MIIVAVLCLAVLSIALVLVAVTLKSRSVATLNFMICVFAGVVVQPWDTLSLEPPVNEDLRLLWIAALIWAFLFLACIVTLIYCIIITKEKKPPKHSQKRRKRRKRKSRREVQNDQIEPVEDQEEEM